MAAGSLQDHLGKYASVEDDGFIALNNGLFAGRRLHRGPRGPGIPNGAEPGLSDHRPLPAKGHLPQDPGPGRPQQPVNGNRELRQARPAAPISPTAVTEMALEDGAQVEHYRLLNEGSESYHVGSTRVCQARDSRFTSTAVLLWNGPWQETICR